MRARIARLGRPPRYDPKSIEVGLLECDFLRPGGTGQIPIISFLAFGRVGSSILGMEQYQRDRLYGSKGAATLQERVVRSRRSRWACSSRKIVVSTAGEAYDAPESLPNRKSRLEGHCEKNEYVNSVIACWPFRGFSPGDCASRKRVVRLRQDDYSQGDRDAMAVVQSPLPPKVRREKRQGRCTALGHGSQQS